MSPDQLSAVFAGDELSITYLSSEEMLETEGAIAPIVVAVAGGATLNVVIYSLANAGVGDGVTLEGLLEAAVVGGAAGAATFGLTTVLASGVVVRYVVIPKDVAAALGALGGGIVAGFNGRIQAREIAELKKAVESATSAPATNDDDGDG